jgi:tetratricopeptide (TPR) repeat protein
MLAVISMVLSGCADSGQLHPYVGQQGLLMPIQNPDKLVLSANALTLYLGDTYNDRNEGGQVIFGHRLTRKLRDFMGGQVASVCRTFPCYADAARAWNRSFILIAKVRRDEDAARPEGILTITRWSIDPLIPQTTATVSFPLDSGTPPYEKILRRGIDTLIAQTLSIKNEKFTGSVNDVDLHLKELLSKGEIDQALRLGERTYAGHSKVHLSKNFYSTLYSLEESAGNPGTAKRVGETALSSGMASKSLILKMAAYERNGGNLNGEQNILFRGLSLYPNDRSFWRRLIRDHIHEGDYHKAKALIRQFGTLNPEMPDRPVFPMEVYAILVGTGKGEEADQWYRDYIKKDWADGPRPSAFLAHAVVTRFFQLGEWKRASRLLKGLIGKGVKSEPLYRDWMTALGAENSPIEEVHVGREALSLGIHSPWIRDQVTYLEHKGY